MIPLSLELYDGNGIQYLPLFRNLRFAKTFYGGEDLWMTFVLDRSPHLDYPDVAYGNDVILRDGLAERFVGEMRQIDQDVETVTVKALGNWVYLDDYGYGGMGKLWVDTRYGRWKPVTDDVPVVGANRDPERYEIDTQDRLWIAPRRDELCGNAQRGALYYYCPYDNIKRVTFTVAVAGFAGWDALLTARTAAWAFVETVWQHSIDGVGAFNRTIVTESPILELHIWGPGRYAGETGATNIKVTDLSLYGSTDVTPTVTDVAIDIVAQVEAGTPIEDDESLIDAITLQLEPLFYEGGESCHKALKDAASFGDQNNRGIGWGVEAGGYRIYVKQPDRERVRYVVPPQYASRLSARGQTDKGFVTEAWGKYIDEDGVEQWTAKYYAHVTAAGIMANTTAPVPDDDSAQNVYGVFRERTIPFGRVSAALALEFLQQYLIEHAHPQIKSAFDIFGPVQDLDKGGAWIQPYEMEMGNVVQIPYFRAVEAEGAAGVDLREWDTTFLLVGMRYDVETGKAKLIPGGTSEDLQLLIRYVREFERGQEEGFIEKREQPSFRG